MANKLQIQKDVITAFPVDNTLLDPNSVTYKTAVTKIIKELRYIWSMGPIPSKIEVSKFYFKRIDGELLVAVTIVFCFENTTGKTSPEKEDVVEEIKVITDSHEYQILFRHF